MGTLSAQQLITKVSTTSGNWKMLTTRVIS